MTTLDGIPGCARALLGDEVVYEAHSGYADIGRKLACGPGTRFQLASMSKQFTAASVLLLVERGLLALEDSVARWVPRCPSSWKEITVHHLLTHSSGLGHWPDYPEIDLSARQEPANLVDAFQRRSPHFRPGAEFRYSSPGYVLLAQIVERAGDQPYRNFLDESVFAPVGLSHTFAGSAEGRPQVALGYTGDVEAKSFELDVVGMGTGDVWSTASDVLRWNDALRDGDILSDLSRSVMFSPHISCGVELPRTAYGYGWFLGPLAGQRIRYHSGDNSGFKCLNAWSAETDFRFVALSNQDHVNHVVLEGLLTAVVAGDL